MDNNYDDLFEKYGGQYGVDPLLLKAQSMTESSLDPNATGPQTPYGQAQGLAQLVPATAKSLGVTNPNDPEQAIKAQAQLMAENLKRYGTTEDALHAYHGGTNQDNWGPKTKAYADKVNSTYHQLANSAPTSITTVAGPEEQTAMDTTQQQNPNSLEALISARENAPQTTAPAAETSSSVPQDENSLEALISARENAAERPQETTPPPAVTTSPTNPQEARAKFQADYANASNEGTAGIARGAADIGNSITNAGAWVDQKLGITSPQDVQRLHDEQASSLAAYNKEHGQSNFAEAGRLGTQILGTYPLVASGEGVIAGLGEKIPALSGVTDYLGGSAGSNLATKTVSRVAQGATQGAGFNALTGQDPTTGAEVGAGLSGIAGPAVAGTLRAGKEAFNSIIDPLTESGRAKIANDIIQGYAEVPLNINAQEIIPGSKPTLAEAAGNPGITSLQDTLKDINSSPFENRQQNNATARSDYLSNAMGSPEDIAAARVSRSDWAQSLLGDPEQGIQGTLWANAQPASAESVVNKIDNILSGPRGKRTAVKQALTRTRNLLTGEDGTFESDPETLYQSVRKDINDQISGKDLTNQAGAQAAGELTTVRDALDNTIEQGAPGFKNYLSDYHQASNPIEAMQWLQGLKLTDAKGDIQLPKVQTALQNVNKLQSAPGVNAAKTLTDDHVTALENLRDDLLRKENLTLGKSYGSPSVQKAMAQNRLQQVLGGSNGLFSGKINPEYAGAGMGTALGSSVGLPGVGFMAGGMAGKAINKTYAAKNDLIRNKITELLLHPETYAPVTSSSAAGNLLSNPLLHYGALTSGVAGVNRLTQ